MGPELGKLSDYRQACSRPRVLHAALRCPSTSGRGHAPDVRHTDIPVDAGEIHCRKIIALFYAPLPDGMTKVSDIRMENGQLQIEDGHGHRVTLRATGTL